MCIERNVSWRKLDVDLQVVFGPLTRRTSWQNGNPNVMKQRRDSKIPSEAGMNWRKGGNRREKMEEKEIEEEEIEEKQIEEGLIEEEQIEEEQIEEEQIEEEEG